MNGNVYRGNASTMWLYSQAGFNPAFLEEKVAENALAFLLSVFTSVSNSSLLIRLGSRILPCFEMNLI